MLSKNKINWENLPCVIYNRYTADLYCYCGDNKLKAKTCKTLVSKFATVWQLEKKTLRVTINSNKNNAFQLPNGIKNIHWSRLYQ